MRSWRWAYACCMGLTLGCAPAGVPTQSAPIETAQDSSSTPTVGVVTEDYWEAVYLQNSPIGFVHTTREPINEPGERLWRTTTVTRIQVLRFGQTSTQESTVTSIEAESGRLIRFSMLSSHGAAPVRTEGEVDGDRLKLKTTVGDQETTTALPWSDREAGGFDSVNKSLLRQPMQPGDSRTVSTLVPGLDQPTPATAHLSARDWEMVPFGGDSQRLLRIDANHVLAGGAAINVVAWANHRGEIVRTEPVPGMVSVRTTAAAARSISAERPTADIGFDQKVRLKAPAGNLHQARRVVYRVEIDQGRPGETFAQEASQYVASTDNPHVATVTVVALRPGDDSAGKDDAPVDAHRQSNSLLQSDDPRIRRLAAQAVGQAKSEADKAVALERFVHGYMRQVTFSQAFGTAADVAESRQGDCTEFAVLLAALARAAGIPSRVAVGLVYTEAAGEPGFAFHMWDELYVQGAWIPYDATLGLGGIGGGHLKLGDSHLAAGDALASFLPVVQVMGKLTIEVIEVEARQ